MFVWIFGAFLLLLVVIDAIFLPGAARRSRRLMTIVFIVAGVFAVYQEPLFALTERLGVGRPVDMILYFVVVILVRELFISRARHTQLEERLTQLVRAEAIRDAWSQGTAEQSEERHRSAG
ncbi:MAG: DUF2304 domain-containing protein [Myxococcaceae bacterium]